MYIMEGFVDMALNEGQEWPSEIHRDVAITLAIGNRYVTTMDALQTIVQAVIEIPADTIETITVGELPLAVRQFIPAPAV